MVTLRWFRTHKNAALLAVAGSLFLIIIGSLALGQTLQPASATYPGANGKLALVSSRDGNNEVYEMNADGSDQMRLTNTAAAEYAPKWSQDGSKIAFESVRDGNGEVYVMNADGSSQTRLTFNNATDGDPAWSADGSKIAFVSDRSGSSQVYVMNADGSSPTQLTTLGSNSGPTWSPDGTRIAFNSSRASSWDIYVMNADGSGQSRLTFTLALIPGTNTNPDWSPDGAKLAFASARDGYGEVYIMNADGSGQTNLTNNPAQDGGPAWSPDGSFIAFDSNRDGDFEVYVMNADGSGQTNLTSNPAQDSGPNWQPVGGTIVTPTPCPTDGCPAATPAAGLDFSIGTDLSGGAGNTCDSSGTPTATCSVPLGGNFSLSFYLNSLPTSLPGGGYTGYEATLDYTGVFFFGGSSLNQTYWPACPLFGTSGGFPTGQVYFGCASSLGAAPSQYTGRMATIYFTCVASGAVTLHHGANWTDILDGTILLAEAAGTSEPLTINCVPPQAYPGDADGDGCPDMRELGTNSMMGGRRNFLNPWDYMNPTGDHMNRVDDILAVVQHFGLNAGDPGYDVKYDRTYIGPNKWNLGPPNGKIRVDDILAAVMQYGQDCS